MSTNIKVTRHCEFCGSLFVAKTTVTRFCSSRCNNRNYKQKQKNQKIENSNNETLVQQTENLTAALTKNEVLKVKDVAKLLDATKSAIYEMIKSGRLKATWLSPRNIRIHRSDVEAIFSTSPPEIIPKLRSESIKKLDSNHTLTKDDCYSVPELVSLFGKNRLDLYTFMKRKNVPKLKIGKEAFFSKVVVMKVYKDFQKPRVLGLEKERKANERVSKVPLEKKDCYSVKRCEQLLKKDRTTLYSFFKRRNIPKLRIGQEAFYAKSGVDKIVRSLKGKEEL